MSRKIQTIFGETQQGPNQFASDIDALLAVLSPLHIVDLDLSGTNRSAYATINLTISYEDGGTRWGAFAALGKSNSAESAAGAALAVLSSDRQVKPRYIRSLTGMFPNLNSQASVLVLYERDGEDDDAFSAWPYWHVPRVVIPDSAIPPGMTGPAKVVFVRSVSSISIQVKNESTLMWDTGKSGYAYRDQADLQWHGYPTCC